ncbi:MAG: hypothetical protein AB9866_19350 [Syntrophobacteraceae bacterium]
MPMKAPEPGSNFCNRNILDALTWVLFGSINIDFGRDPMDHSGTNGWSVELDFDKYSIHRTKRQHPPEMTVRLFEYSDYVFCCAQTVKELSTDKSEETQKLIEEMIGFSDPLVIGTILKLQSGA